MRSPAPAAVLTAALVVGAALWSAQPAAPRPADIPATEFSAARALPVVERLARSKRVAGTPAADAARRFLVSELRAIPGLEVEVQEITAFARGPYSGPSIYTVRNVVARLPGTDRAHESVLVAAHYDSATMSFGAADDGVGCAAIVEAARCLAAGPPLPRSVIFLLDEGEELGLFGAQGFLHHRWAQSVVTFVNLEAAGCRGRPMLFQSGPGDPWLAAAYARAAPRPHGTVMGQDVFQSGAIPSDTDFRVYRDDGGLRGLDVALYRDGWGYHTALDRLDRLQPGSLQEMGENTVGVVRELASMDIPSGPVAAPAVYYDVLGIWMLSYGESAAWLLALVALASFVHALRAAGKERGIGAREFVFAGAWGAAALMTVAVVTVVVASPAAFRWHGVGAWYARPWLAVAAYGAAPTVLVLLMARRAVLRRWSSPVTAATRLAGGAGIVFALLLAWSTWAGVGSGYLALWWVVGATAAVRLAARGRIATALVVGCAFPGLLTAQSADALLGVFVPIAGRMDGPMEYVIALLVALPFALGALLPAALVAAAPPRWARVALCGLVVAGLAANGWGLLASSPYTAERPQRVDVVIVQEYDVEAGTTRTTQNPFRDDRPIVPLPPARLRVLGEEPLPASPAARLRPDAADAGGAGDAGDAVRRVRVRLEPAGATGVYLSFERGSVARIDAGPGAVWEVPRAAVGVGGGAQTLAFVAPPRGGLDLVLDLRTAQPVSVGVRARRDRLPPEIEERIAARPAWTTPAAHAWVLSTEQL